MLLDALSGGPAKVGVALSITAASSVIPGFLLLLWAKRIYSAQARVILAAERPAA
jgi:hypothetical protein